MELTKREHDILYDWITFNLIPIKSFNDRKTSYGFKVRNPNDINWVFNISSRSPAFRK